MYHNLDLNSAARLLLILDKTVSTAARQHDESHYLHPYTSLHFDIQCAQITSTDPKAIVRQLESGMPLAPKGPSQLSPLQTDV